MPKDKTRYDKYQEFFTKNTKDRRFRLYLSLLEQKYNLLSVPDRSSPNSLMFFKPGGVSAEYNTIDTHLNCQYYTCENVPDTSASLEWVWFFSDLQNHLTQIVQITFGTMIPDSKLKSNIINLIRTNPDPFFIAVIKAHVIISKRPDPGATATVPVTADTVIDISIPTQRNLLDLNTHRFVLNPNSPLQNLYQYVQINPITTTDGVVIPGPVLLNTLTTGGTITRIGNMGAIKVEDAYIPLHPHLAEGIRNVEIIKYKQHSINFTYKLSKHVLHLWLEKYANQQESIIDTYWEDDEYINNIYRNNDGELVRRKPDNTEENLEFKPGNTDYDNFVKNDSTLCDAVKVKLGPHTNDDGTRFEKTCSEYLQQCIIGGDEDIIKCKEFMANSKFWDTIKNEVNNINPKLAQITLDAFNFKKITKNNLLEYESLETWYNREIPRIKNDADEKKIRENIKLREYLKQLRDKINLNPIILNPEYKSSVVTNNDNLIKYFENELQMTMLGQRGIKPRLILNPSIGSAYRLMSTISDNSNNLRRKSTNFISFSPSKGLLMHGYPYNNIFQFSSGMYGGSITTSTGNIQIMPTYPSKEIIKKNFPLIKQLLDSSIAMLKIKGKTFDSNALKEMNNYIEKYGKMENKLIKAIKYINGYINMIDQYSDYDSDHILSLDHIKEFVSKRDKYFDKTDLTQNNLLGVVQRMLGMFNEELEDIAKD